MKIGVLVPNEEMKSLSEKIGRELAVDIVCIVKEENNTLEYGKRLVFEYDVDAIIARNPGAYELQEKLPVPTIPLYITRYDVLRAADLKVPGIRYLFMYHPYDAEKFNYFEEEFQASLIEPRQVRETWMPVRVPTGEAFDKESGISLKELMKYDVVLTTEQIIATFCSSLGLETRLITFDPFDLRCAMYDAQNAVRIMEKERQQTRLVELALDSTDDGFIILQDNMVKMVNKDAADIIEMTRTELLDADRETLSAKSSFLRDVLRVKKREIIYHNEIPYSVTRREVGWLEDETQNIPVELISIINVPHFQNTEQKLRRAIVAGGFTAAYHFQDVVGSSAVMRNTIETARKFAKADSNILLLGETGTGKEVFAQSIHNASSFSSGPFVALNCAAFPESLLESELFGYEDGAFTGARKGGKPGLFELSHGGTLFLDEIGELPMLMQAKLLRCIQERVVYRIGGDKMIPIKNRLICATNRDLNELVKEKKFRMDLLYRINILKIQLPPLRSHKEDVPDLLRHAFLRYRPEMRIRQKTVDKMADALRPYDWPGNVRELEGLAERLLILSGKDLLSEEAERYIAEFVGDTLPDPDLSGLGADDEVLKIQSGTLEEMEQEIIRKTFIRCGENKRRTAEALEIGYNTVLRKLNLKE